MNTIKQLNEKLGEARKRKAAAVNSRASKLSKLEAQMNSEDPDQETIDTLKGEINDIKADIEKENGLIEMYTDQIADLSEVENYETEGFEAFHPGGEGPSSEENEINNYRLTKAIAEAADPTAGGLTGLELEMHQEAKTEARDGGYQSKLRGNVHVPQKVMHARMQNAAVLSNRQIRNDLTATGGTGGDQGGATIETDLLSLIDILRAKLPFVDSSMNARDGLGATFLTELEGDVAFPKAEEDSSDPATKSETGAADEQSPTFGQVPLTPTRLPAVGEVTRQLMLQSSVAVENWFRNYLMYKLSKTMNTNIINYILNLSGTNAITLGTDGGSLTWDDIVKFETLVEDAGESDMEPRMGYLTNPRVKGTLKTTEKTSNTAKYLWNDGEVNSYMAAISHLMPKDLTKGTGTDLSSMIFADWAQLLVGQWGGMDFLVNPYSKDDQGIIRINVWTFFDKASRHNSKFSVCKEIITN